MRIIHTADWHLGKSIEGRSRLEEQERFLKNFAGIVEEAQADMVIIAGDIYDSANPPALAERLFYDTLKKISPDGRRLIVVIAGNHDNPDRLVAAGPLAMDHGIVMAGLPKTVVRTGEYGRHEITDSGEGWFEAVIRGNQGAEERVVMLCVPYPSEKRLDEVLYQEMAEEQEQASDYAVRISKLFRRLEIHFRGDTVNLMTAHLFTMGSVQSGSERALTLGNSYLIDGSLLPETAQYIALGHVHKPQLVLGTQRRARYSGAPIHYHKNEASFPNLCYQIDVTAGRPAEVTEKRLPVYKPIEIWKADGIEEAMRLCEEHGQESSYVYLEITTDRYIREDEMKEMKSRKQDILEIKPVLHVRAENSDQTAVPMAERTMEELFADFYRREKGIDISEETMQVFRELTQTEQGSSVSEPEGRLS